MRNGNLEHMGLCKSCGRHRKLGKSHLIPESFIRASDDGSGPSLEISSRSDRYPKRRPIGHYDQEILCLECESKLCVIDDYGFLTLSQRMDELMPVKEDGKTICYKLKNVDSRLLKRFLVSVLWRMSVSENDFANMINLGPLEEQAKEITFGREALCTEFPYFMSMFNDDQSIGILNPHGEGFYDRTFAKLFFPRIQAWIMVDEDDFPVELNSLNPEERKDMIFLARDYEGTSEMRIMQDMVALNRSKIK